MKIVQGGTQEKRPVIVTFFVGAVAKKLPAVLGGGPMIVEIPVAKAPLDRSTLEQLAKSRGAESLGEVAVCGFSAGCHGVRDVLDSVAPDIVFTWDGTHGSVSQPGTMPIAPWSALSQRALQNEVLWVATHTYNTYTDKLKPPAGPFRSTVSVLREVTGWQLPEPTGPAAIVRRHAGMVVESYRSADIDAAAHSRQLTHVALQTVREHLVPRWTSVPALAEPIDVDAKLSHGYRCSVAEIVKDARYLQRWHPAGDGYDPKIGDLVISGRNGQNPVTGGTGHVERIVSISSSGDFETIGGNEDNAWVLAPFDTQQPSFKGYVDVDAGVGAAAVALAQAELANGVAEKAGPAAHEQIQTYHAGARRGGGSMAGMPGHEVEGIAILGPNASDEIPWCASAASWCAREALKA